MFFYLEQGAKSKFILHFAPPKSLTGNLNAWQRFGQGRNIAEEKEEKLDNIIANILNNFESTPSTNLIFHNKHMKNLNLEMEGGHN